MVITLDFDKPYGTLVSSSYDSTMRVWDLTNQRCLGTLEGHSDKVRCLQLHDKKLVTGSDDWSIKYWDLSLIPRTRSRSPSLFSSISGMSSPPQSPTLSASHGSEVLPILDNCCVGTLEGHNGEVTALHWSENTVVCAL
jgi:division protein 1